MESGETLRPLENGLDELIDVRVEEFVGFELVYDDSKVSLAPGVNSRFLSIQPTSTRHLETHPCLDRQVDRVRPPPIAHNEPILAKAPLSLEQGVKQPLVLGTVNAIHLKVSSASPYSSQTHLIVARHVSGNQLVSRSKAKRTHAQGLERRSAIWNGRR